MNKSHARKHLRSVNNDLQKDFMKLKEVLSETTQDMKGKATQILTNSYDDLKSRSDDMQDNIVTYVSEKPFKSLGIAFLSGIIVGILIKK